MSTTYVVGTAESVAVKIGYTSGSVDVRVAQLQTGNAERLVVLMTIENNYEKALHRHFAECRIPGGEWFNLPSDFKERIDEVVKSTIPADPLIFPCTGSSEFCTCGEWGCT